MRRGGRESSGFKVPECWLAVTFRGQIDATAVAATPNDHVLQGVIVQGKYRRHGWVVGTWLGG